VQKNYIQVFQKSSTKNNCPSPDSSGILLRIAAEQKIERKAGNSFRKFKLVQKQIFTTIVLS
jgi:hypothetical protein